MKTRAALLLLIILGAGCSNFEGYMENRLSDFRDIFRLTVGPGLGVSVEAQAGPLRATAGVAVYGELGFIYGRWKNSLAFLDGHAEYKYTDTRGWCGVGWKMINPNWIRHQGVRKPPICYEKAGKNCDPRRQ